MFFKSWVNSKVIPRGERTEDGELLWLDQDEVLDSKHELVDDINNCFKDIVRDEETFFITAQLNDQQQVLKASIAKLDR